MHFSSAEESRNRKRMTDKNKARKKDRVREKEHRETERMNTGKGELVELPQFPCAYVYVRTHSPESIHSGKVRVTCGCLTWKQECPRSHCGGSMPQRLRRDTWT